MKFTTRLVPPPLQIVATFFLFPRFIAAYCLLQAQYIEKFTLTVLKDCVTDVWFYFLSSFCCRQLSWATQLVYHAGSHNYFCSSPGGKCSKCFSGVELKSTDAKHICCELVTQKFVSQSCFNSKCFSGVENIIIYQASRYTHGVTANLTCIHTSTFNASKIPYK